MILHHALSLTYLTTNDVQSGGYRDLPKAYEEQRRAMQKLLAESNFASSSSVGPAIAVSSDAGQMAAPPTETATSTPVPRRLRQYAKANAVRARAA